MIEAVIFDMDGVLIDSEEFICEAAIKYFQEQGLQVQPEDFKPFIGTGENRFLGGVAEKYHFLIDIEPAKIRTYAIYHDLIRGKVAPLPGAIEFIHTCKNKFHLRTAVATSADNTKMVINLEELNIPQETFDTIVTGTDIVHKKPHPEIFLTAAQHLGVSPENCLVVEDAINGVEAAKRAGCKCLALTTSFNKTQLAAADWICTNLEEAPMDVLKW